MSKTYRKISRGQVWYLVDKDAPTTYDGSIQGKNRPVLVVSNNPCNQFSPVIHVVPLTTQVKTPMPTHVHFNDGKYDQIILCEQTRLVHEKLFYDNSYYKYTLSDDIMQKVDEALAIQFGLSLVFPNSEKFWKSVESMIRIKVKAQINELTVDAMDISKLSTMLTIACDDEIAKLKPIEKPQLEVLPKSEEVVQPIGKRRNKWTFEQKKEFVDDYYKHGTDWCAKKYGLCAKSVWLTNSRFKKEIENAQT